MPDWASPDPIPVPDPWLAHTRRAERVAPSSDAAPPAPGKLSFPDERSTCPPEPPVRRRPGLRAAPRRQDRGRLDGATGRPRRPLAGLHARRRPRSARRSPPTPTLVARLHLGVQHRRGRHRRHRRARPRRHRPGRRDAGHGGQGAAVQAVRRRRRGADLPRHHRRRRDRRDGRAARAELRRHQPRGHLRAALLRDRAPAQGAARHPGLPRRPARHRRRRARRAAQRAAAHRPHARRPARRHLRRRRGRRRDHEDPARGRHRRDRGRRPQGRRSTRRATT